MPPNEEDEKLIEQIRSGQEKLVNAAINTLFERNYDKIAKIVRIGGGEVEDIKMILYDAVLVLIIKIQDSSFDLVRASLDTFIYKVAKNKWLDELKRRHQTHAHEITLGETLTQVVNTLTNSIEAQLITEEERAKIVWALQQLDYNCRELFHMKYMEGISLKEIANKLGMKEDAIKKRHERCKEKLKAIFGHDPRTE